MERKNVSQYSSTPAEAVDEEREERELKNFEEANSEFLEKHKNGNCWHRKMDVEVALILLLCILTFFFFCMAFTYIWFTSSLSKSGTCNRMCQSYRIFGHKVNYLKIKNGK